MRHGESIWNLENKFTGWYDIELSERGHTEAIEGGKLVKAEKLPFDMAFTSVLKRAIRTRVNPESVLHSRITFWVRLFLLLHARLDHVLEESDHMWIPVVKAWQLNERHYGALTGLDKKETVAKHGSDQVNIWRRSYDVPPPGLDKSSEHYPGKDRKYKVCLVDKPRLQNISPPGSMSIRTACRQPNRSRLLHSALFLIGNRSLSLKSRAASPSSSRLMATRFGRLYSTSTIFLTRLSPS